jgi:hypothetical protein
MEPLQMIHHFLMESCAGSFFVLKNSSASWIIRSRFDGIVEFGLRMFDCGLGSSVNHYKKKAQQVPPRLCRGV